MKLFFKNGFLKKAKFVIFTTDFSLHSCCSSLILSLMLSSWASTNLAGELSCTARPSRTLLSSHWLLDAFSSRLFTSSASQEVLIISVHSCYLTIQPTHCEKLTFVLILFAHWKLNAISRKYFSQLSKQKIKCMEAGAKSLI